MVLCVKTPIRKTQDVKQHLIDNRLFHPEFRLKRTKTHIFFPIIRRTGIKKKFPYVAFEELSDLPKVRPKKSIKSLVENKLSSDEIRHMRRAYDVIGEIAILDIPDELEKKEKIIAQAILDTNKNITTVVKKKGYHDTEFRTQPVIHLAGKRTKETVLKELGVRLKLNVETVYFSPRLSAERKRIAQQVRTGESVLVMFSGCAPYPCVISRNTKAREIIGIELNPEGHRYGIQNIELNHLKNISLINADAKTAVPKLNKKFDRIIMPLPKSAGDFLEAAFSVSKKGTIIHFYAFEDRDEFRAAGVRIDEAAERFGIRTRILRTVKCGQQSPGKFRICVDFKIL